MNSDQPIRIELPTSYGMQTVNAYLFVQPEPVLIDCGEDTDASWEALTRSLAEQGLRVSDLSKVIITHAHIDHMGMIGRIGANSDAEIWVSDLVYEWAVNLEEMARVRVEAIDQVLLQLVGDPEAPLRQMFLSIFKNFGKAWTTVSPNRVKTFGLQEPLSFGGKSWQTLYTPGHSNTQSSFYHPGSGQYLSSDMLLRITPTPVIESDPETPEKRKPALPQMLESYQRVAKLPISQVFPGHYEPFVEAHVMIEKQVGRIHQRKEQAFQLIQEGNHHFLVLLDNMYGKRLNLAAVPMMLGYLDLLEAEERIRVELGKKGLQFLC